MVVFEFFVHCQGWQDGGYRNRHFADSENDARRIIDDWNANGRNLVELISVQKITVQEFAEDFIGQF